MYIGQAIKLNYPSLCSILNFNKGLKNISFNWKAEEYFIHIPKLHLSKRYRVHFGCNSSHYKFTLRLWAFLLKSKTEYGHLLCWLLYYHFLSEDQSLELISVDLFRHRGKYCQKRIKKRLIFILCAWMFSLHLCLQQMHAWCAHMPE